MAYTTQYIGSRYVPLFAEPAEWDSTRTYEPLTIVMHDGNSYTSRQYVPVGIKITNEKFWALTGNYNAQVEQYRQEVRNLLPYDETPTEDSTKAVTSDGIKKAIAAETTRATTAEETNATAIAAETNRATTAEDTNATAIANEITRAKSAEKVNTDAVNALINSLALIYDTPEMYGAKGDGVTNDTAAFAQMFQSNANVHILKKDAIYNIQRATFTQNCIIIGNNATLTNKSTSLSTIEQGKAANILYGENYIDYFIMKDVNVIGCAKYVTTVSDQQSVITNIASDICVFNSNLVIYDNVDSSWSMKDSLQCRGCSTVKVHNSHFSNCGYWGNTYAYDNVTKNAISTYSQTTHNGNWDLYKYSDIVEILNCTFTNIKDECLAAPSANKIYMQNIIAQNVGDTMIETAYEENVTDSINIYANNIYAIDVFQGIIRDNTSKDSEGTINVSNVIYSCTSQPVANRKQTTALVQTAFTGACNITNCYVRNDFCTNFVLYFGAGIIKISKCTVICNSTATVPAVIFATTNDNANSVDNITIINGKYTALIVHASYVSNINANIESLDGNVCRIKGDYNIVCSNFNVITNSPSSAFLRVDNSTNHISNVNVHDIVTDNLLFYSGSNFNTLMYHDCIAAGIGTIYDNNATKHQAHNNILE